MQHIPVLNTREKKRINELLEEQWGITEKFDYVYIQSKKNRLFFVNKDIERLDMKGLRLSSVGLYVGEILHDKELRLSIDGSQLFGPHATKNII